MGSGPLRKDVENNPGSVQYPALQFPLNIALLTRAQGMIEENNICPVSVHGVSDFFTLAVAHKQSRGGHLSRTCRHGRRLNACRAHQLPKLVRVFSINMRSEVNVNQNRFLTDIG